MVQEVQTKRRGAPSVPLALHSCSPTRLPAQNCTRNPRAAEKGDPDSLNLPPACPGSTRAARGVAWVDCPARQRAAFFPLPTRCEPPTQLK